MQAVQPIAFAELYARSCFSFLTGASHPEELVEQAVAHGYAALAITDECSMAGIVRAWSAWKTLPKGTLHLIIGTSLHLADGPELVLLATDRAAYGRLSSLITRGRRAADKGSSAPATKKLRPDRMSLSLDWRRAHSGANAHHPARDVGASAISVHPATDARRARLKDRALNHPRADESHPHPKLP